MLDEDKCVIRENEAVVKIASRVAPNLNTRVLLEEIYDRGSEKRPLL